jgi:hypothetical protein
MLGKNLKVKSEDILMVKVPKFTKKGSLLFFNEKTLKQELCELTKITEKAYEITYIHKGETV